MDNNYWIGPAFFAAVVFLSGAFLIGSSFGYDNGYRDGKSDTVLSCTDKPKQCKIIYDYLKLQRAK